MKIIYLISCIAFWIVGLIAAFYVLKLAKGISKHSRLNGMILFLICLIVLMKFGGGMGKIPDDFNLKIIDSFIFGVIQTCAATIWMGNHLIDK